MNTTTPPPRALLLVAPGCPHCASLLELLCQEVKGGSLARLEVANIASDPEPARQRGVRSVPWLELDGLAFEGSMTPGELREWLSFPPEARLERWMEKGLKEGRMRQVETLVRERPEILDLLLGLLEREEAAVSIRLGAMAILEEAAGGGALSRLVPRLGAIATNGGRAARVDACYLLGLTGTGEARPWLESCLGDENPELREVAREALATLGGEPSE